MEDGKASLTALITAFARAYHSANADPKIFDDFLAARWFTNEGWNEMERNLAGSLAFFNPALAASCSDTASALEVVLRDYIGMTTISRSRFTEDCLETAIEEGIGEYVILGAGFDTFAFRRPDLLKRICVFEVDHPATQALKRRRLEELGWEIPQNLYLLPVDFAEERFPIALLKSPYDPKKPALFSWLGVSVYLERSVVLDTLRAMAEIARPGSTVIFDYYDADAFRLEKVSDRVRLGMEIAKRAGEPMKTGFDSGELKDLLGSMNLHIQEDMGPSDIEERYFRGRTDGGHAFEHIRYARALVK